MRKLILLCVLIPIISSAQKQLPINKLSNIKAILEWAAFLSNLKYSYYDLNKADSNAPISSKAAGDLLDSYLKIQKPSANNTLLKKNISSIKKMFSELIFFGDKHYGSFFLQPAGPVISNNTELEFPVTFSNNTDGGLTLVLSPFFDDDVYNTLKLTAKQRATRAIQSFILPALKSLTDNYVNSGIKYFCFSAIYGSKDFSSEALFNMEPEYIGIVASSSLIKKYLDSDITEQQFINHSDTYAADRIMISHKSLKKISITLE